MNPINYGEVYKAIKPYWRSDFNRHVLRLQLGKSLGCGAIFPSLLLFTSAAVGLYCFGVLGTVGSGIVAGLGACAALLSLAIASVQSYRLKRLEMQKFTQEELKEWRDKDKNALHYFEMKVEKIKEKITAAEQKRENISEEKRPLAPTKKDSNSRNQEYYTTIYSEYLSIEAVWLNLSNKSATSGAEFG